MSVSLRRSGASSPTLSTADSAVLAVGIVGATVMPHAIYLHSALTQDLGGADTSDHGLRRAARATRTDVLVALSIAGAVNAAILLGAASLEGHDVDTLTGAHRAFGELSGPLTATLFGVALLASSLAATSVGVYSGQVVLQGFTRRRIPLWVRRCACVVPAVVLLASGVDATAALVLSQVVLAFGIPFAVVPLLRFTGDAQLMGVLVNGRALRWSGAAVSAFIIVLNAYLVAATLHLI